MARASKLVTIDAANRDRGKVFLVTEMPPRQSEKWATRALLAVSRSNSSLGAEAGELADSGMAGLAAIGFRALSSLEFEDAEPLLDEMLSCVSFVPDPSKIDQLTQRPLCFPVAPDDIEEVSTLLALRSEVIEIHTGFSPAAFLSTLGETARQKLNSSDTPTSPTPSEPS